MIVAEWMCDIVCLWETWLSPELPNSLFSISGFSLFRRDRFHDKHGGLLIFVSTHLSPIRRIDLEDIDIECIVLELTLLSCGPCLLYFCYRPPSYSPEIYFDRLSPSLSNSSADRNFFLLTKRMTVDDSTIKMLAVKRFGDQRHHQ